MATSNAASRALPIIVTIFLSLCSGVSGAVTNGFEAMAFRPTTDGGRYFGVWDTDTLKQGKWSLGTVADYSWRPFQLTMNGARQTGILDNTVIQHIFGSVGIIDKWLEVGLDVPIGWWVNYKDPNVIGAAWENKTMFGDIRLNLKTNFLDVDKYGVGIALVPFLGVETGKGGYYFGNGGVTGGGSLVVEGKPREKLAIALNAGIMGKRDFSFRGMEKGNQIIGGFGVAFAATEKLSASAEMLVKTRLSGPFQEKIETPLDVLGGVKYGLGNSGFTASAAAGGAIIRGSEAPYFRAVLGMAFDPSKRHPKEKVVRSVPDVVSSVIVPFDTGSSLMEASAESIAIGKLAAILLENPKCHVEITGYTDSAGSANFNERLSRKRAGKVAQYMTLLGVPNSRMTVIGKGEADPIGDNVTIKGRAANRRTEVKVTMRTIF